MMIYIACVVVMAYWTIVYYPSAPDDHGNDYSKQRRASTVATELPHHDVLRENESSTTSSSTTSGNPPGLSTPPPPTTISSKATETTAFPLCNSGTSCPSRRRLTPVPRATPLHDQYITLWLHQVHRWFSPNNYTNEIRSFLQSAQQAGFSSVMTDLPWDWTEREGPGDIRLDTFSKDWMAIACEMGLGLHVVLNMRGLPPWLTEPAVTEAHETGRCYNIRANGWEQKTSTTPSFAHPQVWDRMQQFVDGATRSLLDKYGTTCIRSLSPSQNPEFETKMTVKPDGPSSMMDYSYYMQQEFHVWQKQQQQQQSSRSVFNISTTTTIDPPILLCDEHCAPTLKQTAGVELWMGFREEFLARRYERLCQLVREKNTNCLLHFGEFFSTLDQVNVSHVLGTFVQAE